MAGRSRTGTHVIEDLQYELKYIPYQGKKICVYTFGEGDNTIVSLPSFPHSGLFYLLFLRYYSNLQNIRFVTFDLPGWIGRSDNVFKDKPYNLDEIVKIAEAVIAAENIEKYSLIGYSFGGRIALRLAASHPERLKELALVSTIINGTLCQDLPIVTGIKVLNALKFGKYLELMTKSKVAKYLKIMETDGTVSPKMADEYRNMLRNLDGNTTLASIYQLFHTDWSEDLQKLSNKRIMVVNSKNENQMFRTQAKSIRETLSHEKNYFLNGSHEDFIVNPTSESVEFILDYLSK